VSTNLRVTIASPLSRELVASQPGRATRHVMTIITMPVATGMEETAVAPTITTSARNARAVTAHMLLKRMPVQITLKVLASCQISKEMAFATTKTTTLGATGTKVTAAAQQEIPNKWNIVKPVSAWIVSTRTSRMNALVK